MLDAPLWLHPCAAYLHIPFCAHHCGYCDFAIATGKDHLIDAYLDALIQEMATLEQPHSVETFFLGGGTPTYLSGPQLHRLFCAIEQWLPLQPGGELSIEANPDTLEKDKVRILAGHGVNRVSLGAQSFHADLLHVLERQHIPHQVERAFALLRPSIDQVSLDLIFGIPGQTLDQWQSDLEQAVGLGPDHLSTYGLTYEKGTPLWKQRQRGEVVPLTEDQELSHYRVAMDFLPAQGFEQYEISNFARPGAQCRHNLIYWANEAYLGFGMGAARYVQGRRELNTRDLATYLRRVGAGESPTFQSEQLEPFERAQETMAIQLRRVEGINRKRFAEQTGYSIEELVGDEVDRLMDQGLLMSQGDQICLTVPGREVADGVIERLLRVTVG